MSHGILASTCDTTCTFQLGLLSFVCLISTVYFIIYILSKDVIIEDVHASKLVLIVGLDVDVQIVRTCLALDLNLMNQMAIW